MPGTWPRKLGMKRVVCPPGAGAGSTIGMLMAPARVDRVASFTLPLASADMKSAEDVFAELEEDRSRRRAALTGADIEAAPSSASPTWPRYIGQGSEITVTMPSPAQQAERAAAFRCAKAAASPRRRRGPSSSSPSACRWRRRCPARAAKLELPRLAHPRMLEEGDEARC